MRSIGHWGALTVVFALLLSPMAQMLESPPSELERTNPKSLTVVFSDGATASESVAEGNTNVADYDVTFADGASSLSSCTDSGADAGDFTSSVVDVDTCRIEFASPPDYESPSDADTNNQYEVVLIAEDNDGDTDSITLTITVTDVDLTVIDNDVNLAESTSYGDVLDLDNDGDTTSITWSITSGNEDTDSDGAFAFAIASDTGIITVADPHDIDYESNTGNSFDLVVQATDGTNADTETITITITDTAPHGGPDHSVSLHIDSIDGAHVTDFTATDDNTSISWSIASGCFDWDANGACMFIISGSNESAEITMNDEDDLGGYAEGDNLVLVVSVTDGVSTDTVTVTITIVGGNFIYFSDVDISSDTGYSDSDFITNIAAQTLTATLSAPPQSNQSIQVSVNAGSSWSEVTEDVSGVSLSTSITLTGSSEIHLRVADSDGNYGPVSVTSYVFDDTTPTLVSVTIAASGDGHANEGDTIVLTFQPSEEIQEPSCAFFSQGVIMQHPEDMSPSGPVGWVCAVEVSEFDDGHVSFTIDFSDLAGNQGVQVTATTDGSSVFIGNGLVMTIAAAEIGSGGSSDDQSLFLTFTSNEATTNFVVGDITVSNAAISSFSSVSSTVYTATLTPASIGWVTVDIAAGSFTSSSTGEDNIASTQFTWEWAPNGPTMTVASDDVSDGGVTSSPSISLSFTSDLPTPGGNSDSPSNFTQSDIYANHCEISDFSQIDGSLFTAICTLSSDGTASVSVLGGVFEDSQGVPNFPSNTLTWTYDSTGPSMTISSSEVESGDSSGHPEIWLTFVSNEPTADFEAGDISVSNGVFDSFTTLSSTMYMGKLTPVIMGEATIVAVGGSLFHDSVGNPNSASSQFIWTYLDVDTDGDGTSDHYDEDDDNDGVPDNLDDLPLDPTDSVDTDGDGIGNTADDDDDNDGWSDQDEYYCGYDSLNSLSAPSDEDEDGLCNEIDTDDDGDGVPDEEDAFPLIWSETTDTDDDGIGDNSDSDDDGDGVIDEDELACISDPLDSESLPIDTDGDTICDALDGDSDGDSVPDSSDPFPLDSTQWEDADGDGLGDNPQGLNADPFPGDMDNDGYPDIDDPLPLLATPGDMDNDGYPDDIDAFPAMADEWEDFDGDGIGDNADPDDDNDGWSDVDEEREGTNPKDPEEKPVSTFQLVLPGTWNGETIALDAWDLVGIFGGGPIILWLLFAFATRNTRTAKVEARMRVAKSRQELNEIAEGTEYLLMLRLLGVHQGIKLERIRAELDDVLEAKEGTDFAQLDQTSEVEKQDREEEWGKEPTIDTLDSLADDLDELYDLTKEE